MKWETLVILIVTVVVYILMGALVFLLLEQQHETDVKKMAHSTFISFTGNNTCVLPDELETFVMKVITAYDAGVITASNVSSSSHWNYGSSVFFAITVITTIGYGHLAPSTSGGQAFCMLYAVVGIPLCAVILVGIGERLARPYMKFNLIRPVSSFPRLEKMFRMILFTLVCLIIFTLIPAAIIMHFEEWTYLQSWYFTIVTLTTVGFGDFVPDQKSPEGNSLYKAMIGLWIFCGLAWLAMVFHMVIFYVRSLSHKIDTEAFEVTQVVQRDDQVCIASANEKQPLQMLNGSTTSSAL